MKKWRAQECENKKKFQELPGRGTTTLVSLCFPGDGILWYHGLYYGCHHGCWSQYWIVIIVYVH